jgi:hypothetical protein
MIKSCQLSILNVLSFSLNMHMNFKTKCLALLYRKQTTYVYELWPFHFFPPFYLQLVDIFTRPCMMNNFYFM